jgi:hypothetical protein
VDPIIAIGIGVAVVLVLFALVLGRRRRATALEPTRLGPSWTPSEAERVSDPAVDAEREDTARRVAEQTGLDREVVDETLAAWWEYLAVLRIGSLPRSHRYRFYDPYDPPVAERGPDGPIPDPVRVARDVAQRSGVVEIDAAQVLAVVAADHAPAATKPSEEPGRPAEVEAREDDGAAADGIADPSASVDDAESATEPAAPYERTGRGHVAPVGPTSQTRRAAASEHPSSSELFPDADPDDE